MFIHSHLVFQVADMQRSLAFYQELLGLEPKFRDGETWTEYDIQGMELALLQVSTPAASEGACLGLQIEDIALASETLEKNGVLFTSPVIDAPPTKQRFFQDPDGNQIYIYQLLKPCSQQ